jgi:hypothetical protein
MRLDERLEKAKTPDGKIDFGEHISRVRQEAVRWLQGNEKNGIDHSRRLEDNLNDLIPDEFKRRLKPVEVFVLLYAVYLHDIGYRKENGEIDPRDHPLRSKNYSTSRKNSDPPVSPGFPAPSACERKRHGGQDTTVNGIAGKLHCFSARSRRAYWVHAGQAGISASQSRGCTP